MCRASASSSPLSVRSFTNDHLRSCATRSVVEGNRHRGGDAPAASRLHFERLLFAVQLTQPPPRVGKTHSRAMPGLHAGAVIHDLQLEPSATAVRTDFNCAAPGERGDAVDHGVLDQ